MSINFPVKRGDRFVHADELNDTYVLCSVYFRNDEKIAYSLVSMTTGNAWSYSVLFDRGLRPDKLDKETIAPVFGSLGKDPTENWTQVDVHGNPVPPPLPEWTKTLKVGDAFRRPESDSLFTLCATRNQDYTWQVFLMADNAIYYYADKLVIGVSLERNLIRLTKKELKVIFGHDVKLSDWEKVQV